MLPPLPKKNKRDEADFGTYIFKPYVEKHPEEFFGGQYELKDSKGKNYLNFKEVSDQQVNHGLRGRSPKGNLIRIVVGNDGAPDYVFIKSSPSYIVIKYPKFWCLISVDLFLMEKKMRKSLTSERAKEIAVKVVDNR